MKLRNTETIPGAINRMIKQAGEDELAEAIDKSASLIRRWADPDHDSIPNLRQAMMLDRRYVEICGGEGPLLRIYIRRVQPRPVDHNGVLNETLDIGQRFGELLAEVQNVVSEISDGGTDITATEAMRVQAIVAALQVEIDQMQAALSEHTSIKEVS